MASTIFATLLFAALCVFKICTQISSASIYQEINDDQVLLLDRQIKQIQNWQPISDVESGETKMKKLLEAKEKAIDDFLWYLKNAWYSKMLPKCNIQIIKLLAEKFVLTRPEFSTETEIKIGAEFTRNLVKYEINFHPSENGNVLETSEKLYKLRCKHRISLCRIEKQLLTQSTQCIAEIKCNFCDKKTPFDVDVFLANFSPRLNLKADIFKTPLRIVYCAKPNGILKKCPRKSCNQILDLQTSHMIPVATSYSEIKCAEGHVFCAFCNASFDHSPATCDTIRDFTLKLCPQPYHFTALKAAKNGFIAKESHIPAAQKSCTKCEGDMLLFFDWAAFGLQEAIPNIEKAKILICYDCKSIEATKAEAEDPFFLAFAPLQRLHPDADASLETHLAVLQKAGIFFLMLCVKMAHLFELAPNNTDTKGKEARFQCYAALWASSLRLFSQLLQTSKVESAAVKKLSAEISDVLAHHSLAFKTAIAFEDETEGLFEFKRDFPICKVKEIFDIPETERVEYLKNYILCDPLNFNFPSPNTKCSSSTFDLLEAEANRLLGCVNSDAQLSSIFLNAVNRPIAIQEARQIVRDCRLEAKFNAAFLQQKIDELLRNARMERTKTCYACFEPFCASGYKLPECGHDFYCQECTEMALDTHISEGNVNPDSGLVKCLEENCHELFHPQIVKEMYGAESRQWREYSLGLLERLSKKLKSGKFVSCPKCKQEIEIVDENGPNVEEIVENEEQLYVKQLKMVLQTIECPFCTCRFCANCRSDVLHFSTSCGKLLDSLAAFATMCSDCKQPGMRVSACPDMTCLNCHASFCFACGVAPKFEHCINETYPGSYYTGEFNRQRIDTYHSVLNAAVTPILKELHAGTQEIEAIFANVKTFESADAKRLASLLKTAFSFHNWHRFLQHYIKKDVLLLHQITINSLLDSIKEKAVEALSFLAESSTEKLIDACKFIVNEMQSLDSLVKCLRISNKFLLNQDQFDEYKRQIQPIKRAEDLLSSFDQHFVHFLRLKEQFDVLLCLNEETLVNLADTKSKFNLFFEKLSNFIKNQEFFTKNNPEQIKNYLDQLDGNIPRIIDSLKKINQNFEEIKENVDVEKNLIVLNGNLDDFKDKLQNIL